VAVNSDLTDRLKLKEKQHQLSRFQTVLRERDEQLRAVFTGVRDYAIFTVDLDGKISSWHEGAALMKGYTAEEAIGMPFANLFTQEDRDRDRPRHEMDVAARTGEYKGDGKRVRANGDLFDAAVVLTALRGPDDKVLGYLKLTQDITERRRQERQREEMLRDAQAARAEAERTSHMMGEFLATISHELRTPLGAILGWSHMLSRETPDASTLKQGIAAIARNARVQVQLIEDLLDMSRIESGQLRLDMQPVVPADVVAKAIDAVLPGAAAKGIAMRTVLDPRAGIVSGDPDRLQQIIWNLLSNAVKFTPSGGTVTVAVTASRDGVNISVADTGQGISPEFVSRMFDRFQQQDATTTRRQGGLGIGLSIARQLAELHGGGLRAESAGVGKGATFTLFLPLIGRTVAEDRSTVEDAAAGGSPESADRRLNGVSVLLIDDEADGREIAGYLLGHAGANVLTAASAREGFGLLRSARPQVVVSDIGMPVYDGYDFIRWVRELSEDEGGQTPAIAFTAFSRTEDRERAISLGYHMHLSKPAEAEELIEAVASAAKVAR
jgi:PAS domain S-box-containing protein